MSSTTRLDARSGSTATDVNEALMQFLYRAPIGLVQATLDGTVEMMNPVTAQLLMPLVASRPLGDAFNLFDVLAPVAPDLRALVDAFEPSSGVVCDAKRVCIDDLPDGRSRVYAMSLLKVDATRLMAVLHDASGDVEREQRTMSRRLHDAARVDALTRLPNRVAMTERIEAALAASRSGAHPSAVLLVGCERLQQIGESFGDEARNAIVSATAGRLRGVLRADDAVGDARGAADEVARVAGDEFVVLLRRLGRAEDANAVAQRLLDALSRPHPVDGRSLHCPVSVGLVRIDADRPSAEDVLRDAAIAMNEAKRSGGSRAVEFERAMRERAIHRGGVEMELRRALAARELFVVYQPIVRLQDGDEARPAGVEALVRWRHPERGVIAPIDFIGVAEETGLIGPLGAFVLEAACTQFMGWSRTLGDRAPQKLAVNLSRAQLADSGLTAVVRRVLASTGMPPDRLQLEVTESLAAQDDAVQGRLHELKALGIGLALDDFGTGYSSLSSLHLLPVDTVKIDRSFVTLLDTSPHHRVLIEATILVSKSLGMTTVAEGIETQGQADIIRSLGCDKGQGYRFSRPLEADDLCRWFGHP